MNRNFEHENHPRKSAYSDFDQYGNPLTGNTNSLSRYTPQSSYGSFGRGEQSQRSERDQHFNRPPSERLTNATRAYGDMSHGTHYGEGGSISGGGSSYGHSDYGLSRHQEPGFSHQEGYWPESRRYGMGDYDKFINRNYGYFGRSSGGGYTSEDSDRPDQSQGAFSRRNFDRTYEDTDRQNSGYDRGYSGFSNTGYGSAGYNMRDLDRERSALRNRGSRDARQGYGQENDRNYTRPDAHRESFNPDMEW